MAQRLKTVAEVLQAGNPSKLSAAELRRREALEKGGGKEAPTVPSVKPKMPKHVREDEVAKKAWRDAVRVLTARGTVTGGEAVTLAVYAVVYSTWVAAVADVRERGIEIDVTNVRKDGTEFYTTKTNPNVKVKSESEKQLLSLSRSLGLTPDSREKAHVEQAPKPTKFVPKAGTAAALMPELFNNGKLKQVQ